jgi:hypothetical protein
VARSDDRGCRTLLPNRNRLQEEQSAAQRPRQGHAHSTASNATSEHARERAAVDDMWRPEKSPTNFNNIVLADQQVARLSMSVETEKQQSATKPSSQRPSLPARVSSD